MEWQIISKRIKAVMDDITRLSNVLYALDTTDIQRYPDNYEVLSTDAALRAEKIACRLRHLIYSSTTIKKAEYLTAAGAIHGINIRYENNIMEITLPCLFPKRKKQQSTEFLIDPIYYVLDRYYDANPVPKFKHCVVCFSRIYSQDLPSRQVRDYDNLELKEILDVVATFAMADDSGLLCDAYNTTELGETDCTQVSVMGKDSFPLWLESRKNGIKSISDF